ncbi:tetratricopeptide repeat protein [Methylovulum psychrotolerans]|uniref:NB-ARC domain-containing protein n=1 Tax=Methylovulum psychrotolerans TaxID=1704499 RepID=A0A2S5CMH5_9GAMM|nr:tetratricopeptide repeat protein [Methylovulum psychrotolerans]POZ52019.1 NB-ARC domain-containing protein [Methylovulum psychrotolerans]
MPYPGGGADKMGNYYEALWTVYCLLRILKGEATGITLEPLGDEGDGVEFKLEINSGSEYHQVKRQNGSAGHWKLPKLNAKGVLAAAKAKLGRDEAAQFWFISQDSVANLPELCERAVSAANYDIFKTFALDAAVHSSAFAQLCAYWDMPDERVYACLRCVRVETLSEDTLLELVKALAATLVSGNEQAIVASLRACCEDYWHRPLDHEAIVAHLENAGFTLIASAQDRLKNNAGDTVLGNQTQIGRQIHLGNNSTYHETHIHYAEKSLPRHLTTTPFIPDVFEGRDEDLLAIRAKLEVSNQPLLLVNGQGGIGKTSLAAKYWQSYQSHYTHTAWLYAPSRLDDALLMLALPLQVNFPDTMLTAQRLELLQAAVANLSAPCLLIIDNANDAEELAQHWGFLHACTNCHILLTSRLNGFNGTDRYPIKALPEAVALRVFNSHYPQHRTEDDGLFASIYQAVGGNTLVLELLAKNLAAVNANKVFYPLSQLLADLQQRGLLRLAKTKTVKVMGKGILPALQAANPTDIIAALYDELERITPLSEAEQRLLCNLAVLPAENWAYGDLADLLLTAEADEEAFSDTLSGLAACGWLENSVQNGISHYKTSPVVQEITRHKNSERLQGYCSGLVVKLIDKLAHEANSGHLLNASYADAAAYCRHAETVAAGLPGDDKLAVLHGRIGRYHLTTGNPDKALRAFTDYHTIMAALHQREPDNLDVKNNLAVACQFLGITHTTLGDLQQALRWYEEFQRLKQELHAAAPGHLDFKNGLAIACQYLGNTHTTLGDLRQALRWYEDHHRLAQELHAAAPGHMGFKDGLGVACQKLGSTHTKLGDPEQALRWYEEFQRLEQELHAAAPSHLDFTNGLAIALIKLGLHYEQQGNLPLAIDYYQQAQALLADLVSKSPLYVEFQKNLAWVNGRLESGSA